MASIYQSWKRPALEEECNARWLSDKGDVHELRRRLTEDDNDTSLAARNKRQLIKKEEQKRDQEALIRKLEVPLTLKKDVDMSKERGEIERLHRREWIDDKDRMDLLELIDNDAKKLLFLKNKGREVDLAKARVQYGTIVEKRVSTDLFKPGTWAVSREMTDDELYEAALKEQEEDRDAKGALRMWEMARKKAREEAMQQSRKRKTASTATKQPAPEPVRINSTCECGDKNSPADQRTPSRLSTAEIAELEKPLPKKDRSHIKLPDYPYTIGGVPIIRSTKGPSYPNGPNKTLATHSIEDGEILPKLNGAGHIQILGHNSKKDERTQKKICLFWDKYKHHRGVRCIRADSERIYIIFEWSLGDKFVKECYLECQDTLCHYLAHGLSKTLRVLLKLVYSTPEYEDAEKKRQQDHSVKAAPTNNAIHRKRPNDGIRNATSDPKRVRSSSSATHIGPSSRESVSGAHINGGVKGSASAIQGVKSGSNATPLGPRSHESASGSHINGGVKGDASAIQGVKIVPNATPLGRRSRESESGAYSNGGVKNHASEVKPPQTGSNCTLPGPVSYGWPTSSHVNSGMPPSVSQQLIGVSHLVIACNLHKIPALAQKYEDLFFDHFQKHEGFDKILSDRSAYYVLFLAEQGYGDKQAHDCWTACKYSIPHDRAKNLTVFLKHLRLMRKDGPYIP